MAIPLPDLSEQAYQLNQLDLEYQVQNILNAYVLKNLLLVGQAPNAQTATFINPNLYRVAVQYYGNADLWTVIAAANNLADPNNQEGRITLLIPPAPTVGTGGILSYSNPPNILPSIPLGENVIPPQP